MNKNHKFTNSQNHKIGGFKTTKFVILALSLFLLFSCTLSPDNNNNDKPSSACVKSSITIYLNGEDKTSILTNNILAIDLDAEQSDGTALSPKDGFLEIKLQHFDKDNNKIQIDTNFISSEVQLNKRSPDTVGINLNTTSLPIGLYQVKCESSAGSSFSKQFDFYVYSSVTGIKADYSVQDPIPGIEYQNENEPSAKEGTIQGDGGVIYLATNSVYSFNLSATNNVSLGAVEYLSYGTHEDGRPILRWSGSDNNVKSLITHGKKTPEELVEKYIKNGETDSLPYFEIKLKGTQHTIKRHVILRQYINADITETEAQNDTTRYISLTKDDGVKYYKINTIGTTSDGSLQFALPEGTQNNLSPVIPDTNWKTTATTYATFGSDIYFDLYFNGTTKMIKITPHLDTIHNNKNIDFYLHVKDSEGNYLGYWKILIGGVVEKISIKASELKGTPGQSGTVNAEVFPSSASVSVLWYVSSSPYSSDGLWSPDPSEDATTKNIISMLPYPAYKTTSDNKIYTVAMKDRAGSGTTKYYNAMVANPGVKNGVSTLVYTLGTIAHKAYLTALVCKIDSEGNVNAVDNYSIYASVPITISATGEVALRSVVGVKNTLTDNDTKKEYKLDPYINENNVSLELPNRETGQYYPSTAEDGIYGVATRSFYFPHNANGEILIDIYGIDKSDISLSPTAEADKLFTIMQNDTQTGVSVTITPLWYQYWRDGEINASKLPPKKKGDYLDGFGYFTDYIGIGNVYFTINGSSGILRIVIYDNNKYDKNLITN